MIYDSIDLDWHFDGDYTIGDDGDIGDTSYDYLKSVETEIVTIIKSKPGDWEYDRNVGAGIDDFVGLQNTAEVALEIKSRILTQIQSVNVASSSDLYVRIIPVSLHAVMIYVSLTAQPTSANRLGYGDKISISIAYDTAEDNVFQVPRLPKVG